MFRPLAFKRDREMGAMSKPHLVKDVDGSDSTVNVSFNSDDVDSEDDRPGSCAVVTDYESDSIEEQPCQESVGSTGSTKPRGGLRQGSEHKDLRVAFSDVTIRSHALCIGDNPAVSLGVPISIHWKVVAEETTTVDAYDAVHPTGKGERELALSSEERLAMVRKAGYTTEDVRCAVRQVNATKMEREQTVDTLQNAAHEEFMENLKRGFWNATIRRSSKKTERSILQKLREKDAKRV